LLFQINLLFQVIFYTLHIVEKIDSIFFCFLKKLKNLKFIQCKKD
jgi:hypothetical protein